MEVGSIRAILYEVCHVIDEVWHAIPFPEEWEYRFCQWAHRYDWHKEENREG